jgi:integrase
LRCQLHLWVSGTEASHPDFRAGRRGVPQDGQRIGHHAHNLRHTAASLAVSAGANVKAVQRMLGHANASMTLDL